MHQNIVGISALYHDSAAALPEDGHLQFALQEERVSRIKFDSGFPSNAISLALQHAGRSIQDIDAIAFFENPPLKLDRILKTLPREQVVRSMTETWDQKLHISEVVRHRTGFKGRIEYVCDELTREGKIDHAALATYEPEVERYGGGELWRHSEICFSTDSEFACRMSVCIDEDSLGEDAVVFAMAMSWLHLAKDFGVSLEQASALLRAPKSLGNKPPYWQLESGAILRRTQSWVADVASSTWDDGFVRTLTQASAQRSRDSRQAVARLAECLRMDEGWREWLLRAHAHLSINRMTRWDMVDSEVIALSLATRIADSLLARGLKRLPDLNEVAEAI